MMIRSTRPHCSAAVAALLVFAGILCARAIYISLYSLAVPYWDQWDAEGAFLLIPWENAGLTWSHMFAAHNEHRIFWSRALSLLVYEAGGEDWNNQTLAYVSSGILALVASAIAALAWASRAAMLPKLAAVVLLLAMGTLPFAWENIVAGFQNQFYFMMLWGVMGISIAVLARGAMWRLLGLFAAVACIFSMASGVIWVGAMVFAGIMRAWQERRIPGGIAAYLLALSGIMFWGLDLVPEIESHASLKPTSASELMAAILVGLSWPLKSASWAAIPLWLPAIAAGLLALRRRLSSRPDQFMLALAVMAAGQVLAIAYSRGKGIADVPSRYTELLMLGMVANAWLAFRMPALYATAERWRAPGYALTGAACLWLALLATGLVLRTPADLASLQQRHQFSCIQTDNLRRFLTSGEVEALRQPAQQIPYPSAERLASLASDPALKDALMDLRDESATEGCVALPRRSLQMQVDESSGSLAVGLPPGAVALMRYESLVEATVEGVSIQIGTYGGLADGRLRVEACIGSRCTQGDAPLAQAADNQPLMLEFKAPLNLKPGDRLLLSFATQGATHPLAIWSYGPANDSLTITAGQGSGRTTKATLLIRE